MARTIVLKTKSSRGTTEILTRVAHPMETGLRVNKKTKKKIPEHYIEKLTIELNGKKLAEANLGPAASKNPTVGVKVSSAKAKSGSKIKISWSDNKGEKGSKEATI